MIRIVQASLSILMFTTVNEPASSKSLNADFWLFGEAELKARISPDQIEAKAGVCKFLDTRSEADRLKAHALCQFPAGPLMGDFTFTKKPDGTIDFVDRDGTYTAILYRCSK